MLTLGSVYMMNFKLKTKLSRQNQAKYSLKHRVPFKHSNITVRHYAILTIFLDRLEGLLYPPYQNLFSTKSTINLAWLKAREIHSRFQSQGSEISSYFIFGGGLNHKTVLQAHKRNSWTVEPKYKSHQDLFEYKQPRLWGFSK